MSTIESVNTQQVLQMGVHTEKVQQTIQQTPQVAAQQAEEERLEQLEIKQKAVQEPENSYQSDTSNPDGKSKSGRLRIHHKSKEQIGSTSPDEASPSIQFSESLYGGKLNVVI